MTQISIECVSSSGEEIVATVPTGPVTLQWIGKQSRFFIVSQPGPISRSLRVVLFRQAHAIRRDHRKKAA